MRITQYKFLQPLPVLDRSWGRDRAWERSLAERLRQGNAMEVTGSLADIIPSRGAAADWPFSQGWEAAEKHSENAIRTGAVFLNDTEIARRTTDRERRKKAYAEYLAENRPIWEVERKRREEDKAVEETAKAEAVKAWQEKVNAVARREEERSAEWREERLRQKTAILTHGWNCQKCMGQPEIREHGPGYVLQCLPCDNTGYFDHSDLLAFVKLK